MRKAGLPAAAKRRRDSPQRGHGVLHPRALRHAPEENIIHENGVKLAVDVLGGQKTGYFLDQKDNHLFVRQFCKDARVLDCFSYIGAFALNAAAARSERSDGSGYQRSRRAADRKERCAQRRGYHRRLCELL